MVNKRHRKHAIPPKRSTSTLSGVRGIQKIKRYFQERAAAKKLESPQDRASRRTATATVAIAFLTLAVVVVGGLQYLIFKGQLKVMADQLIEMRGTGTQTDALIETNKKLAQATIKQADVAEAAQRAWLAPTHFSFANLSYAAEPLVIRVFYQNVGREPARGVRNWLGYGYIRSPVPAEPSQWGKNLNWHEMTEIKPAEMCRKVSATQQSVVYPNSTFGFSLDIKTNEGMKIPISALPELFVEVKEKRAIYFVMGCLSYETLGQRKNSTFCAFLDPVPGKEVADWSFAACPVGNDDF